MDANAQALGVTIDAYGRITWTPTADQVGVYPITLTVTDAVGASVEQQFDLTVQTDDVAPEVRLVPSVEPATLGESVSLFASATDNVGVDLLSLTVNGQAVALDANGIYTFTPDVVGEVTAIATATDAAGNTTQTETIFSVLDFTDVDAPEISLPDLRGQVFTAPTEIVGTVNDDNLVYYSLSVAKVGSEDFREIFRGSDPVVDGVLGTFDPSLLENDAYTLRLTAVDAGGNVVTQDEVVTVAGELKLGNFQLSFTDLTIPVTGIPISVTRTYDTLTSNTTDDFGYGWRLEFRDTDLRTSLPKDETFEQLGIRTVGFEADTRVYITLPGGQRQGFTFKPILNPEIAKLLKQGARIPEQLQFLNPAFESDLGVTSTLSVRQSDASQLIRREDGVYINPAGQVYNPADSYFGGVYVLTTKEGIVYEIDGQSGDLLSVTDTNGNTLTYTDSAITSSTGQQVTFERDAQGRITTVTDPLGNQVTYEYDALGDLVAVTDREGNVTQFKYDETQPHYLDEVIDPLGRSGVQTEYNDQGRLTKVLDVNGEAVELIYDPENSLQTVKDVLGNLTTYEYDQRGNVITEIDAVGKITKWTYDNDNNVLSKTIITDESGPDGWTTDFTYDNQKNQTSVTDALGNTTYYSYGAQSRLTSETDVFGNTNNYGYDPNGNLLSSIDEASNITQFGYSSTGTLLYQEDVLGHKTHFNYDANGNLTELIDAEGNVAQYTYDANGNRTSETRKVTTPSGIQDLITRWTYDNENRVQTLTDGEGNITQYQYDANGRQIAIIDALGNKTENRYDERGQLVETIYSDATPSDLRDNPRIINLYDRGGRLRASIDQAGRGTHFIYDEVDRLVETIHPDNNDTLEQLLAAVAPGETLEAIDWTKIIYPDASPTFLTDNNRIQTKFTKDSRVKATIDERGNKTEYRYDAMGRVTETIFADDTPDDLNNNPKIIVEYDKMGRPIANTDALGRTTLYEYDDLGRVVNTKFHDDSEIHVSYDARDRQQSVTDQSGKVTTYQYDKVNRLTGVSDALGFLTEYKYDEAGRLTEVVDANNHATKYQYDKSGRRTAVELPLGQRSISRYDSVGNLQAYTDFNGEVTQYIYDTQNRLVIIDYEDNADVSYAYTPTGRLASTTDGRGITQSEYDELDRLISRTDPDGPYSVNGKTIEYTYDEANNRTSVVTPNGRVNYTYDERNRLSTVIDSDFNITTYDYDSVGNLTRTEFANGVIETRAYDELDRLVYLENKSNGEIVSSYRYNLNKSGHRTSVTEADGRQVEYLYDDLYRVTQENINNSERVIHYTYDNVGNRLSRNDSANGVTNYTYDENDRLLTEILIRGANEIESITYTYDNNGNQTQRTKNNSEVTNYQWNDDNRLVRVDLSNGNNTEYTYDSEGIRVSRSINGDKVNFLVDKNRPYAQVLEESINSNLVAFYSYGHDLISQQRSEHLSYYQVDGLGSTRILTDNQGEVTDTYTYDSFGDQIGLSGITENSYRFAGEQFDKDIDSYYLRQRYYQQSSGRFNRRDTYEGVLSEPLTIHKYSYTHNNPVNGTDPSGLLLLTELKVAQK